MTARAARFLSILIDDAIQSIQHRAGRTLCRVLGHHWAPVAPGYDLCTRNTCRGHTDAIRYH